MGGIRGGMREMILAGVNGGVMREIILAGVKEMDWGHHAHRHINL